MGAGDPDTLGHADVHLFLEVVCVPDLHRSISAGSDVLHFSFNLFRVQVYVIGHDDHNGSYHVAVAQVGLVRRWVDLVCFDVLDVLLLH